VPAYVFLSDEWLAAVRRIVDEQNVEVPAGTNLTMNLLVTGTPFPDDRRLHIAIQDGTADWSAGHADGADLTLTTDYDTARAILISGDPQAALQAFMEGKVKIQGDLTKLMTAQATGAAPGGSGLATKLREITEA
jgi:putative sterol carrier protein